MPRSLGIHVILCLQILSQFHLIFDSVCWLLFKNSFRILSLIEIFIRASWIITTCYFCMSIFYFLIRFLIFIFIEEACFINQLYVWVPLGLRGQLYLTITDILDDNVRELLLNIRWPAIWVLMRIIRGLLFVVPILISNLVHLDVFISQHVALVVIAIIEFLFFNDRYINQTLIVRNHPFYLKR